MSSVSGLHTREYVPPFSASFAQRISRIHENRENAVKIKENDVLHARANIGSTFRVPSADRSRSYNMERSFGPVRPLSAGRSRSGSNSRSSSAERSRLLTSQSTTNSEVLRTMTSFDKELQFQRDIAAHEKQKVALLQVKKEAYINYLKNKGNTPWVPGGAGPKHETSTHKSINRNATEYRMQYKAWCRSPWPGLVASRADDGESVSIASTGTGMGTFASATQDRFTAYPADNMGTPISPSKSVRQVDAERLREGLVPPRLGGVSPQRARPALSVASLPAAAGRLEKDPLRSSSDSVGTPSSWNRTGGTPASLKYRPGAPAVRKSGPGTPSGAVSGSNSKYVALTVRIIDTAHPAQKSSYGVFIVPRNCTRLEMIANIERQFNVPGQVSDVSITYRSGYSHGVTVSSLSMGTMADIPQVDDYSSITIYLNGATTFDAQGNVHTHPDTAAAVAAQHQQEQGLAGEAGAVPTPSVLPGRRPVAVAAVRASDLVQDLDHPAGLGESPESGGSRDGHAFLQQRTHSVSAMGLTAADNLLVFEESEYRDQGQDGTETVDSFEEETVVPYDGGSLAGSARSKPLQAAPAADADLGVSQSPQQQSLPLQQYQQQQKMAQPQQAPTYMARHPDQPMHGFSYASPMRPLLGGLSPQPEGRPGEVPGDAELFPHGSFRRTSSARFTGSDLFGANAAAEGELRAMGPRTSSSRSLLPRTGSSRSLAPRSSSVRSLMPRASSTRAMVTSVESLSEAMVAGGTRVRETEVGREQLPVSVPQRPRRDWLGEAEERLREERAVERQGQGRGQGTVVQDRQQHDDVVVPDAVQEPPLPRQDSSFQNGITSPVYRWGTASSLSRRRSKASVGAGDRERDSVSVDGGRAISAGRRTRSVSADFSRGSNTGLSVSTGVSRSRALSPQLSLRSTASSRGRSAFINSRAAELEEVNLRLYGEMRPTSPRRRSNSVGRDARVASWTARSLPAATSPSLGRNPLNQLNGSRFSFSESNYPTTSRTHASAPRLGGMARREDMERDVYLPGKVFSRSSEELFEKEEEDGPSAEYTTREVRAPTVHSHLQQVQYSGPYGDLQGEGHHRHEAVTGGSDCDVTADGGGHHGANGRAATADRTTRRQLSRSLEQLLEEAS